MVEISRDTIENKAARVTALTQFRFQQETESKPVCRKEKKKREIDQDQDTDCKKCQEGNEHGVEGDWWAEEMGGIFLI